MTCAQVLFTMTPRSFTTTCTASTPADIEKSVVPPGVTMPANADMPPLVSSCHLARMSPVHALAPGLRKSPWAGCLPLYAHEALLPKVLPAIFLKALCSLLLRMNVPGVRGAVQPEALMLRGSNHGAGADICSLVLHVQDLLASNGTFNVDLANISSYAY